MLHSGGVSSYDEVMLRKNQQAGQIALVVLLIMSVTLVIAVSLAKGTSQEISRTTKKGETVRIFSAAESGAGYLLTSFLTAMKKRDPDKLDALTNDPDSELAGGNSSIEDGSRSDISYAVEASNKLQVSLAAGEATELQFMDSRGNHLTGIVSVDLRWGKESVACDQASLVLARYYDPLDGRGARVAYTAVGPHGCPSRNDEDGFGQAQAGSAGFANQYQMVFNDQDLFLRVLPVYHSTEFVAFTQDSIPIQQRMIRAEAVNQLTEEEESQSVLVSTTNLQLPGYLDYAIYSSQSLAK